LTLQEAATGTYTYSVSGVNANGTGPSSAASNSVVVASLFAPSGAYDSIATTTVGSGGASSITFSSIPATYTHLQLRGISRINTAATGASYNLLSFNSDTTAGNYYMHTLAGTGAVAVSEAYPGQSGEGFYQGESTRNNLTAGIFASNVHDILDYANTSKYKTIRTLNGWDANGSGEIYLSSGLWMSTSAITSITINPVATKAFVQYTQFALYGIKGA